MIDPSTRPEDASALRWTVAVPTYNGASHIREALRGALAQADVPFELLIIDDRSEDETLEIAREVAGDRARVEQNSERLGLAGNWNRCVELARTAWVAFLHQDDLWRPGQLRIHDGAARSWPDAGWIGSPWSVIDDEGRPVPHSVVPNERALNPGDAWEPRNTLPAPDIGGQSYDAEASSWMYRPGAAIPRLLASNPLRCSAVSIKRRAHQSVSGFDARYRYVVDWEFWIRVARRFPVVWVEHLAPTVFVRWHEGNESHRLRRGVTDLEEIERFFTEVERLDKETCGDRWPGIDRARKTWLARAYLNRAQSLGFASGEVSRGWACLKRAFALDPSNAWSVIARDPRLAAQIAAMGIAPWWVRRRGKKRLETRTSRPSGLERS